MKGRLLLGTCVVALCALAAGAGPVFARPTTTNAPAIFTVKVTLTDHRISMTPTHAARGSTVTFILTNRGKKRYRFVFGDATRHIGTQGFARTLAPHGGQSTVVMFLNFRGILKYQLGLPKSTRSVARGSFRVT
jgi:hypothetical protein